MEITNDRLEGRQKERVVSYLPYQNVHKDKAILLLTCTGGQVSYYFLKGMQTTQFCSVSLDTVTQRYAECLGNGVHRFGPMLASSIPRILNRTKTQENSRRTQYVSEMIWIIERIFQTSSKNT
jgi:hypothetical protein